MTFTHPLMLLLGLLAVPVVWLHLRRGAARRVEVSSDLLWEEVLADERLRAGWQPWRRAASLAVSLVLLALLTLAAADPRFGRPRQWAVLWDNSAAAAAGSKTSHFEDTQALVADFATELQRDDTLLLLTVAAPVAAPCGPTGDRAALQAAIAGVKASQHPPALDDALAVLRAATAELPNCRWVFVGCRNAKEPSAAAWLLDAGAEQSDFTALLAAAQPLTRAPAAPSAWLWPGALALVLLAAQWGWCQRLWLE